MRCGSLHERWWRWCWRGRGQTLFVSSVPKNQQGEVSLCFSCPVDVTTHAIGLSRSYLSLLSIIPRPLNLPGRKARHRSSSSSLSRSVWSIQRKLLPRNPVSYNNTSLRFGHGSFCIARVLQPLRPFHFTTVVR